MMHMKTKRVFVFFCCSFVLTASSYLMFLCAYDRETQSMRMGHCWPEQGLICIIKLKRELNRRDKFTVAFLFLSGISNHSEEDMF